MKLFQRFYLCSFFSILVLSGFSQACYFQIDSGWSLSEENESNLTKLLDASRDGEFKIVKSLSQSENFRHDLLKKNLAGLTPLMLACEGRYLDIVELLLKTDSSLEHLLERNDDGLSWTALLYASYTEDLELVRLLLKANSSLDHLLAKRGRYTVLLWAIFRGHLEVVKLLVSATHPSYKHLLISFSSSGDTALMVACMSRNSDIVNFLLETDPSIALLLARDREGLTALMQVSRQGHLDMVQLLLHHNSSPDHLWAKDYEGRTALAWASKNVAPLLKAAQSKVRPRSMRRSHGSTFFSRCFKLCC